MPAQGPMVRTAVAVVTILLVLHTGATLNHTPAFLKAVPLIQGPVDDAKCNVETVERANDHQLSAVLNAVLNTTFFSVFKVDLDKKCQFWGSGGDGDKSKQAKKPEEKCGTKLPVVDFANSMTGGQGATSMVAKDKKGKISFQKPKEESACGLKPATTADKFTRSDPVAKGNVPPIMKVEASDNCELPEFWLDMCHDIPTTDETSKYTDLKVNPERWTGYNGSKVWAAIYKENCFSRSETFGNMCYEERVLYRLLSGMHSSINVHIAMNYFPPGSKDGVTGTRRQEWHPNPRRYDELFNGHPERLKNMHFSFVVALRALRKATPYLYNYSYSIGDPVEDVRTQMLMRRLLETHILSDCGEVFEAFDESLLFGTSDSPSTVATLKKTFKGVFRNISRVLDCVPCQKCKLHGKVSLLGVGTALKILLLPEDMIAGALSREEVVALVQTVGKLSEAISGVKVLFAEKLSFEDQYFSKDAEKKKKVDHIDAVIDAVAIEAARRAAAEVVQQSFDKTQEPKRIAPLQSDELADAAVGVIQSLYSSGLIDDAMEDTLVGRALDRDPNILILAKRYISNPVKFLKYALREVSNTVTITPPPPRIDAVIVGAGLAGLTAAVTLVDRGANVVLIDKMKFTGGNSAYASSGVNAVSSDVLHSPGDSWELFLGDCDKTLDINDDHLLGVLVKRSYDSLEWFRNRSGLSLDQKGQLGGHSSPRTYRPSTGMAGSEMVFAITKIAKKLNKTAAERFKMMLGAELMGLDVNEDGEISGVSIKQYGVTQTIETNNVILATGGYASDRKGEGSLLHQFRPDLEKYETTNGPFSTGDGHKIAVKAGAKLTEMSHVQVHPTAFKTKDDKADRLTLCAEILRGTGAILLDRHGKRFADELGKRDYLTQRMNEAEGDDLGYTILLNEAMAQIANKHVPHYINKNLLTKLNTISDIATWMKIDESDLRKTFSKYHTDAENGTDEFGKRYFHNPVFNSTAGPFYAGTVTPAIHYTMGGVAIDTSGRMLKEKDGSVFPGLYAAGEITGGVHGTNRLGGNALTEAIVFGSMVGSQLKIGATPKPTSNNKNNDANDKVSPPGGVAAELAEPPKDRKITAEELSAHATQEDCWISVYGKVYDFTDFVEEHPGGVETMTEHAGKDGTEIFDSVHTRPMLDDFEPLGDFV